MGELEELRVETRAFAEAREWGPFHTPKNLVMAIAGEAGELVAEFRWLTPEGSASDRLTPEHRHAIEFEMADVLIFLLRLGDVLDVDLAAVVRAKLAANEHRFPPVR